MAGVAGGRPPRVPGCCPWCGGAPEFEVLPGCASVVCLECGLRGPSEGAFQKAIRSWDELRAIRPSLPNSLDIRRARDRLLGIQIACRRVIQDVDIALIADDPRFYDMTIALGPAASVADDLMPRLREFLGLPARFPELQLGGPPTIGEEGT